MAAEEQEEAQTGRREHTTKTCTTWGKLWLLQVYTVFFVFKRMEREKFFLEPKRWN